jgi:hypothetical protein
VHFVNLSVCQVHFVNLEIEQYKVINKENKQQLLLKKNKLHNLINMVAQTNSGTIFQAQKGKRINILGKNNIRMNYVINQSNGNKIDVASIS